MADYLSPQDLVNAKVDAKTLGEALNDEKVVKPRYGKSYDSFPLLVRKLLDNGGFRPMISEAAIKAYVPTVIPSAAKDMMTMKIWWYGVDEEKGEKVPSWHGTGLSELERAKEFTNERVSSLVKSGGSLESLYDFQDNQNEVVVQIKSDGNIVTPQADLYSAQSTADFAKRDLDSFKESGSDISSLFSFDDSEGAAVVIFKKDGDIVTPLGSFYENQSELQNLSQYNDFLEKSNTVLDKSFEKNLFEFKDSNDRNVICITKDSFIELDGGLTLSKASVNSGSDARFMYAKEEAEDAYLFKSMQRLLLTNTSTISPFVGSFKQKFSIKNTQDFLNLKIKQTEALSVDTPYVLKDLLPYSSQVVHPYICEFPKTVHGWRYILALTPFHLTRDLMENPCIYGSNDLKSFELLKGFDQPLAVPLPLDRYNYNSDNCAVFDHQTGEFICLYRNTVNSADNTVVDYSTLHIRRTKDFVSWKESERLDISDGDLSPTLVYDTSKEKWVMFGGHAGLAYRTADRIEGPWTLPINIPTPFICWHQEVRFCGNHYVGIFNDLEKREGGEGDIYFGISSDGINWEFSDSIFDGDFNGPYKPSISHEFTDVNHIRFNIVWTSSDRNTNLSDKWRLYTTQTKEIEVI